MITLLSNAKNPQLKMLALLVSICAFRGLDSQAHEAITLAGVRITYVNNGDDTDFAISYPLGNLHLSNIYVGLGLNSQPQMVKLNSILPNLL
jgi:hypothetical protein